MFTLAHELAHLWLGDVAEGLSGFQGLQPDDDSVSVERFCGQAAAEFLVPAAEIRDAWRDVAATGTAFENLARHFKVSPVVIGRRAMDLGLVEPEKFFSFYRDYTRHECQEKQPETGGGDFYNNQSTRVGQRFAKRVI